MNTTAIQKRLETLTEKALQNEVIVPLLHSLGYTDIRDVGGPYERGRDLVCWTKSPLGEDQLYAVQVKKIKPTRTFSAPGSLPSLIAQLRQALDEPILDLIGGQRRPDGVLLITPFPVRDSALEAVFSQYTELRNRGVQIVDGPRLAELLSRHLPSLAAQFAGESASARTAERPVSKDKGNPVHQKASGNEVLALDQLATIYQDLKTFLGPEEPVDPTLCFVIMSFSANPQLEDFYEKAIKPAVSSAGYRCERVDEQHFNGSVMQQVLKNIRIARFVIADLTEARPNCYYELGVAHALRKEVIHLANSTNDIHFDVKDFNFILYSRIDQLKQSLTKRILGTVGQNEESGC